jgi:hypothetical protein
LGAAERVSQPAHVVAESRQVGNLPLDHFPWSNFVLESRKTIVLKRLLRWFAVLLVMLGIALAAAALIAYRAARHVPDFYAAALSVDPAKYAESGDALERDVLELHNSLRRSGRWEATFTADEINGWLAIDLAEKFADRLPAGIDAPRVAIGQDAIQVACRYDMGRDMGRFQSVVSLSANVYLTEEPNVVAVHVQDLRAGAIPLPLKQFLDQITDSARRANVTLRWQQVDGDPVALVMVPETIDAKSGQVVQIDGLELRHNEIAVFGTTHRNRE